MNGVTGKKNLKAGAKTKETGEGGGADVAIIGMACLFPNAPDVPTFWRNISAKVDAVTEPPAAWGAERYQGNGDGSGRIYTRAGGFLGDLYRFDPAEFGIMPSSVDGQEPDQFLALKLAQDALADAGYLSQTYDHAETGVVLGHSTYLHRAQASMVQHGVVLDQTIELLRQLYPGLDDKALKEARSVLAGKLPPFTADTGPGVVPNVMSGRIANRLDLKGPNYLIDAACSSSLLAVQAAMQELRSGRSRLMLAGGVNASTPAEAFMIFCQLGALSRKSRIRPFDTAADGTLLGEGLGIVVLKRLEDAESDGDRVYAVLKEVGQASDGRGLGMLAPRLEGEALAIERAYRQSGIDPDSISLIEAHGTGIPLGDQTEIKALRQVMPQRKGDVPHCALGSVKSMISHCIPAAGIAGLIKTSLALYHRILPPTLCENVNPDLELETTPFFINTEIRPWIHSPGRPRRAGINAFGFGGINTHAILEESPQAAPDIAQTDWPSELTVFAANDRHGLLSQLERVTEFIAGRGDSDMNLRDVAFTLTDGLEAGPVRLAVVADSLDDLVAKIARARKVLNDEMRQSFKTRSGIYFRDRPLGGKVAFVFPGEGSQYRGMLADLALVFTGVRKWFDFWDGLYDDDSAERPSAVVFPPPNSLGAEVEARLDSRLHEVAVGSESVFIACQALLELLSDVGVRPDGMVGHSSGENSALIASGIVKLESDRRLHDYILALRRMYREMDNSGDVVTGAMLTVGAVRRDAVLRFVEESQGALHVALDNCFHQSVLFGTESAVAAAAEHFRSQGGLCSYLAIDRAYHTLEFKPVARAIEVLNRDIEFGPAVVPLYSCSSAGLFPADSEESRGLAADQWATGVRFTETIQKMFDDGFQTFVEVGPASNLTGFIGDILRSKDHLAVSSNHRSRPDLQHFQNMLGQLFVHGCPVSLDYLFHGRGGRLMDWDGEAPRRRKKPPLLDNTLPYIQFDEGEATALRGILAVPEDRDSVMPGPAAASSRVESPPPEGDTVDSPEYSVSGEGTEGILLRHFDLMRNFLTAQNNVIEAAYGVKTVAQDLPFISRMLDNDGENASAEFDLDPDSQGFLQHHVLYASQISDLDPDLRGLPVVPMAASIEMLVESASLVRKLPNVSAIENVRAYSWVELSNGPRTVTLSAKRQQLSEDTDRVYAAIYDGGVLLMDGEVIFTSEAGGPSAAFGPLLSPQPPSLSSDQLYTTGMFHGPMFQSVREIIAWDQGGIDAVLNDTSTLEFFSTRVIPQFVVNPVLLDAVGQLTAFWILQSHGHDFSSFPSVVERIDLFAANEQATGGGLLRGRLSFVQDGSDLEIVKGDFDCIDSTGRPLLSVRGWQDRFHPVPHRFFAARTNPQEEWYGEDWSGLFATLPPRSLVWSVQPFERGFFEQAGGIFKHLIAQTVLNREERLEWDGLAGGSERKNEWLLGRIALKEAARRWIAEWYGWLPFPADIWIRTDEDGKPFVDNASIEQFSDVPQVSMAHAGGCCLAAAGPVDQFIGVDIEILGRAEMQDVAEAAFTYEESQQIETCPPDYRKELALRIWCAKEAAGKCIGAGLGWHPRGIAVGPLGADGAFVASDEAGNTVQGWLSRYEDKILAFASAVGDTGYSASDDAAIPQA